VVVVETTGDRLATAPLSEIGGQGVFAKEVQLAVLAGEADLAVHSAKDLPSTTPDGLVLCCVPERRDPADALVGRSLAGLGPGATVATGSPRRRALLAERRPDLSFVELRGNMAARLATPGSNGIDAIVAAVAALERLGAAHLIAERLDPSSFTPQVAQGAIALEAREGDAAIELTASIDDASARRCVNVERSFLVALGAGCTFPAGAWCTEESPGGPLHLRAILADSVIGSVRRFEASGDDAVALGHQAAVALTVRS